MGLRVDPDRMATQELGGLGPLAVVFDSLLALGCIRVPEGTLAIAHDEQTTDTFAVSPIFEFLQVALVLDLVFEELVHQFYSVQVMGSSGHDGKIHVGHLLGEEGLVIGPLGEADLEGAVLIPGRPQGTSCGGQGGRHRSLTEKLATIHGEGDSRAPRLSGPGLNHRRP